MIATHDERPVERQPDRSADLRPDAPAERRAGYLRAGELRTRVLERGEMEDVLARNYVGRIAFAWHGRVDILPMSYAYDGQWIYCRTAEGQKLETLRHNPWVAFEVDEVDGPFQWRSVVVHGTVYLLDAEASSLERAAWRRAHAILGETLPDAFGEADPTPSRTVLFRVATRELTGRAAEGRR